jgi:hypothetical protein
VQPAYQPYAPSPQPQHHPYLPQGGAPYAGPSPYESLRGIAGVTVVFLGICAAWPVFTFVLARVLHAAQLGSPVVVFTATRGIESLIGLVGTILFLVWIHRVYVALRAEQGTTRTSPGMAVGGWFIPFANVILPFLSVREAWQRKMGSDRSFIVPLWWGAFVFSTVYRTVYEVALSTRSHGLLETMNAVFPLPMLVRITAYVSWLLIVRWLTDRALAPSPQQQGGHLPAGGQRW